MIHVGVGRYASVDGGRPCTTDIVNKAAVRLELPGAAYDGQIRRHAASLRAARTGRQAPGALAGAGCSCSSDTDLRLLETSGAGKHRAVAALTVLRLARKTGASRRHTLPSAAALARKAGRRKATAGRDQAEIGNRGGGGGMTSGRK